MFRKADTGTYGTGQEAGITISYDALKVGIYGAERENKTKVAASARQESSTVFGMLNTHLVQYQLVTQSLT